MQYPQFDQTAPLVAFIGLGAQKAATSWLHQCLLEHPQLCLPKGKEVHFFSSQWNRGINWYEAQFSLCGADVLKGEISTSYLAHPEAPRRIQATCPDAKLFAILRNPVDRAISHIRHQKSMGRLPQDATVAEALRRYPEIVENGRYAAHLERFFRHVPREQLLLIWYDAIQADPLREVRRVYRFVGVDERFVPPSVKRAVNTSQSRSSPFFQRARKAYFRLRKNEAGSMLIRAGKALGLSGRTVERFLHHTAPSEPRPVIDRGELARCFTDDIQALECMTGRDLRAWRTS